MWPDRVSNPGLLTLESDALPIAPRGPTVVVETMLQVSCACANTTECELFNAYCALSTDTCLSLTVYFLLLK